MKGYWQLYKFFFCKKNEFKKKIIDFNMVSILQYLLRTIFVNFIFFVNFLAKCGFVHILFHNKHNFQQTTLIYSILFYFIKF